MTDREMLEAAAKAAGLIVGDWLPGIGLMRYEGASGNYSRHRWNPLTDDGDEARLEANLGLSVLWGSRAVTVGRGQIGPIVERYQDHNKDKQAARRRAGTRAAAEIGRAK